MIMKVSQAAILAVGVLAMGGCQPKTAAPVAKPPAADYQAAAPATPAAANIRAICYNAADLTTVRSRMVQQELVVATLQCQGPGGSREERPSVLEPGLNGARSFHSRLTVGPSFSSMQEYQPCLPGNLSGV